MKEAYFTPKNIDEKSREFLIKLKEMNLAKARPLKAGKPALLILDMQNYFLDEKSHAFVPSSQAIITKIQNLIQLFTIKKYPVIFTKHVNNIENANQMGKWWKSLMLENSPMIEITDQFNTANFEILEKNQYDAFYNTNLDFMLKNNNIKNLIITGVMTHLCCETTARSAFVRGYCPIIPIDTTATYNETFHLSTFINLSHGFCTPSISGYLLTNEELLK